jgi:hypothetical protein
MCACALKEWLAVLRSGVPTSSGLRGLGRRGPGDAEGAAQQRRCPVKYDPPPHHHRPAGPASISSSSAAPG